MSYILISKELVPPGGFSFVQTGDKPRVFASQPMAESQAQIVSSYRRANGLPRGSVSESLQDVMTYTCQRLGNNPKWCTQVEDGVTLDYAAMPKPCAGCGAKV